MNKSGLEETSIQSRRLQKWRWCESMALRPTDLAYAEPVPKFFKKKIK
jgi:hypothetical protein